MSCHHQQCLGETDKNDLEEIKNEHHMAKKSLDAAVEEEL